MSASGGASLGELEALYRGNLPKFVRTAAAITGSLEQGRDAVHDAFVTAVRKRDRFERRRSLEGWVWRAVVTSALAARRRETGVASFESPNGHGDHSAVPIEPSDLDHVRLAVAALPERQRAVLFLRYYADLGYREIADALDVHVGTVSATLHAAHSALRHHFQEVP